MRVGVPKFGGARLRHEGRALAEGVGVRKRNVSLGDGLPSRWSGVWPGLETVARQGFRLGAPIDIALPRRHRIASNPDNVLGSFGSLAPPNVATLRARPDY